MEGLTQNDGRTKNSLQCTENVMQLSLSSSLGTPLDHDDYHPVLSLGVPTSNIFLVALKYTDGPYVINGDWRLVNSRTYHAAGTTFRYKRPGPSEYNTGREYIIGRGPTNTSLEIMVRE